MPKLGNISAKRRSPLQPSSVGRAHSAGAASARRFDALSEEEWQAIRKIRDNWPNNKGIDWRGEIDRIGRHYWETVDARETWLKKLKGKKPAKKRQKVKAALLLIRQLEQAVAVLDEDDCPDPNLSHLEYYLNEWQSDYDVWVQPFAGKSNLIQAGLELRLIELWKRSGGKLSYSRTKEKGRTDFRRAAKARRNVQDNADTVGPNTPYAPLVDYLKLTLSAILGHTYRPSGIAKMIDRYRGERGKSDPFLVAAMEIRASLVGRPSGHDDE
jgi:hypothetical protein